MQYLASLDQSTTSTKCSIYRNNGELISQSIIEHSQICHQEGYLEHDPLEIIKNVHLSISNAVKQAKGKDNKFQISLIKGIGITNQRETIVCWDKLGKPFYNAIVWCDNRCKDICEQFKAKHGQFKKTTGLPVSTYFSLFKILWLIKNVAGVKQAIEQGNISFGTIDSWVIYNLTGQYVTDASNASRTYLCNLKGQWEDKLIELSGITRENLPKIVDSFGQIATIIKGELEGVKVRSILGDQQSSAYAHQLMKNEIKITYGTGCFLLANIGSQPIIHQSFVTTILYKHQEKIQYAFECSIECGGGTLNWAKRLGFYSNYNELNDFQDITNEDLYFLIFGDIYAPFWRNGVKGGIIGLNLATTQRKIMSSILESIIFRINDNFINHDFKDVIRIYADGGMTKNYKLMQLQANLLHKDMIVRERDTCWGVAKGVLTSLSENIQVIDQNVLKYAPNLTQSAKIQTKYKSWSKQRNRMYGW